MSNSTRRAAPRLPSQPDCLLRCTSAPFIGMLYAGMDTGRRLPMWVEPGDLCLPLRMRGAGLASAVRALRGRGYTVEKVLAA